MNRSSDTWFTPLENGRKNDAASGRHYSARSASYRRDIVDLSGTLPVKLETLAKDIKAWGRDLGFQHVAITDLDVTAYRERFERWLAQGCHGEMKYLQRRLELRFDPSRLVAGSCRAIVARMDYLPPDTEPSKILASEHLGYVSRYAVGRDYHKVVRGRLRTLTRQINARTGSERLRAYTDSAPILEKALAEKAGLGWIGKHTLLLNRSAGSWFFLGEVLTDLPLPIDAAAVEDHCGRCNACINVCPTGAITGPRQLDARRCISYLTIEFKGSIPVELRTAIGNRIFGCDDCQLVCPWNRFAQPSAEADFAPRHALDRTPLLALFGWSEGEFLARTEGSALRRISYEQWQRNVAVALGNAPHDPRIVAALQWSRIDASPLVAEHIDWALQRQSERALTAS
jgi:epoxyqueuosine reductase